MKTIQAYGSNRRSGTATPILQALRAEGGEGLIFGIENETLGGSFEALERVQCLSPDDAPWTLERDGSLGERGVETVFAPSRNPLAGFRQWSVVAKAAGMLSGSATRYGCHVSVDASAFTPLQLCFFASLINGWRQIGETVGGRAQSSYACYGLSSVSHFRWCTEKYRACSRRCHHRLEVRLFRSTLSPLRMQRYIDYIDAVAGVARRETPALLRLIRQTQRTADGRSSSERWDGYPRWLGLARPLLAPYCSPTLLRLIGGLI